MTGKPEKFFSLFDLFSQVPNLRVNGRTSPSTIFGSFLGFLTCIFLLTGISFILKDYFQGLTYNINSFIDNSSTPSIDLKNDFQVAILLTDVYGNEFHDADRIFSLKANFWDMNIPINNISQPMVTNENINFKKCTEINSNKVFKKEFEEYTSLYKNLMCLDFETLNRNLTGNYENFGK